ncbi:hypothetical protein Pint_35845 [Pistacia integerrima]|uniref:Uncharacterized protein n=1 Tax=Pistacia integerrima TaxID=434235 RepID=A0ACC0Y2Y1_9ROSI|nr:hypothetical protein Pint_35845 [Pistacia integerrima]
MSLISFIVFLIIISASTLLLRRRKSSLKQLPPGPPGWPIFGNMFELGSMPHRTLTDLRDKYGEVIWLKFGATNTMVVLSAKAASDFFKNHDPSFAERTVTEIMRAYDYDKSSLALASYGSFWRVLRRLVTVDMIVHKRINETASIRRKCVNDMLLWIEKEALQGNGEGRRCIHVARFVFLSTFNLLGNLMLSRDLLDPDSKDGAEFFTSMMGLMEWGGHPNISDFFPFLRWLDPQGLKRKMKRDLGKALKIASKFVKERVEENKEGDRERKDFLDVLLEFEGNGKDEPAKLSEQQLNIFILYAAGNIFGWIRNNK